MNLKTLKDAPKLAGKKVLVRVDFNVPLDDKGDVKNDKRIKFALPTIQYLLDQGAKQVILMSHVGRPKTNEPNLKTDKIAVRLSELLKMPVVKVDDWGEKGIPSDQVVLLENLRFNKGEKSKIEAERDAFGKQLASLADVYVNDAFSNSHRAHASMTSVPKFIPGFAGFGVEKEVNALAAALEKPEHPMVAVIGGLKADKLGAIANLMKMADSVLVAGALSFSLLKSKGLDMGASKIDDEGLAEMKDMVAKVLRAKNVVLPVDAVVADRFAADAECKTVSVDKVPAGWMALDIGPKTIKDYVARIKEAKTVLWFGPIGVFEFEKFAKGTATIAKAIAAVKGLKIVGGGDSASAAEKLGVAKDMTLVSTGGGASLEMIEGKEMPGLKVLLK
jgi:phosphoglycerate kinase